MTKTLVLFLTVMLLVIGCKKTELQYPSTTNDPTPVSDLINNRKCRLINVQYAEDFSVHCSYNNRGLLQSWQNDYQDGFPDNFTYTYHNNGKLKSAHIEYTYANENYDIRFFYSGDKIIRELWTTTGTNTIAVDFRNTYNSWGRLIKREDVVNGSYSTFAYDLLGNSPLTLFYAGGELVYRADYTFYGFNRNPWLSTGQNYGIPYYYFIYTPWWETSEKLTVYDNAVPEVIQDYDPAQTTWHYGSQFYLADITNFDRVTNEFSSKTFEYENCGSNSSNLSEEPAISKPALAKHSIKRDICKMQQLMIFGKIKELKTMISKIKANSKVK